MTAELKLLAATTAPVDEITQILRAEHGDPFHILGMHLVEVQGKTAVAIRAFLPRAHQAWVVRGPGEGGVVPLQRIHAEGFFEAVFPGEQAVFPYRLRAEYAGLHEFEDPYRFPPVLSDFDLYLLAEGTHHKTYEKLGAHVMEIAGVSGVAFAVWAPNAQRVSVVGNFNQWDGRQHPLRVRGSTGVWEIFIPGLREGDLYKFEIKGRYKNYLGLKSDPYGFYSELRPKTASIVYNLDRYDWNDRMWMAEREARQGLRAPLAIYEVHLGSWRRKPEEGNRVLNYRELAEQLAEYVEQQGFTHVELLPVMEHPLDESWGYQTTGYFAPTSRHGTPEDFMYFVDYLHQRGIGVILDWVPAHFPSDAHGLAFFDGTHLYEHEDPRMREHPDWHTRIFNYGRTEVRSFLWSSALFWLEKYHIDGLRVDAVASMLYLDYSRKPGEWVANAFGGNENLEAISFIKGFNELTHKHHPGTLTIAEESTSWPMVSRPPYVGGLGFSLKWNMGWMHDMLQYFSVDPVFRRYHHSDLTFSLLYAFNENFVLVLSHDEVVHGKRALLAKMPGDYWQQFANLRALYGFLYAHPGKKMLFMGGELGQWIEWNAGKSLDWNLLEYEPHRKLQCLVAQLNDLCRTERALHQIDFEYTGFDWIDFHDADNSVIAFLRRGQTPGDHLVVVCNFTPVPHEGYRVGVPDCCSYREILNTDDTQFGGSGMINAPGLQAIPLKWQNQPCHVQLTLPPLGVVYLKPER
ncbi:MAG: 1,4-alpha-glucan branching protein GlgB [Terriglobia bacterium]